MTISEFTRKHINTVVYFEFDARLREHVIIVRNFNDNKAFKHGFKWYEFEKDENRLIEFALDVAEKELFSE